MDKVRLITLAFLVVATGFLSSPQKAKAGCLYANSAACGATVDTCDFGCNPSSSPSCWASKFHPGFCAYAWGCDTAGEAKSAVGGCSSSAACTALSGTCSGTIGCNSICNCISGAVACTSCDSNKNPQACCTDSFHFGCSWTGQNCLGTSSSYQCTQTVCAGIVNDPTTCTTAGCTWIANYQANDGAYCNSPPPACPGSTCDDTCGYSHPCTPTDVCGPNATNPINPTKGAVNVDVNLTTLSWSWITGFSPATDTSICTSSNRGLAVYFWDNDPSVLETCGSWKVCANFSPGLTATSIPVSSLRYVDSSGGDHGPIFLPLSANKTYWWKVVPCSRASPNSNSCNFTTVNLPPPTCTIHLTPATQTLSAGASIGVSVVFDALANGSWTSINWSSDAPTVASVTSSTTSYPTVANFVNALNAGTANISATANLTGPGGTGSCTTTGTARSTITVTPLAFFQTFGGNVISKGTLSNVNLSSGKYISGKTLPQGGYRPGKG